MAKRYIAFMISIINCLVLLLSGCGQQEQEIPVAVETEYGTVDCTVFYRAEEGISIVFENNTSCPISLSDAILYSYTDGVWNKIELPKPQATEEGIVIVDDCLGRYLPVGIEVTEESPFFAEPYSLKKGTYRIAYDAKWCFAEMEVKFVLNIDFETD